MATGRAPCLASTTRIACGMRSASRLKNARVRYGDCRRTA